MLLFLILVGLGGFLEVGALLVGGLPIHFSRDLPGGLGVGGYSGGDPFVWHLLIRASGGPCPWGVVGGLWGVGAVSGGP